MCKNQIKWEQKQITFDQYSDYLLAKLKLNNKKYYSFKQLSGGMKRRLSLILTLLQIPKIAIFDEVTANVDPELKHEIWDVLRVHQKLFGTITILTSHDSYELQYICNKIYFIRDHKNYYMQDEETKTYELVKRHTNS